MGSRSTGRAVRPTQPMVVVETAFKHAPDPFPGAPAFQPFDARRDGAAGDFRGDVLVRVEVLVGPPGCGKTQELLAEMAGVAGRYVFALPTTELVEEKLADLRRRGPCDRRGRGGIVLAAARRARRHPRGTHGDRLPRRSRHWMARARGRGAVGGC